MAQQTALPPESVRTLRHIEREAGNTIARTETELGGPLGATVCARLIDFCLEWETAEAARQLRALNLYCPN